MKPATLGLIVLFSAGAASGQSASPAFDIADVYASAPGARDRGMALNGNHFVAHGTTLFDLIREAYEVEAALIAGGPIWLQADRFDIAAQGAPVTPRETMLVMLQTLLAERFHLVIHREDRPMPVWALRVAKGGLKLKESSSKARPDCRERQERRIVTAECQNITMDELALRVRDIGLDYIDHAAVNLTGVPGAYDFTLVFTAHGWLRKASDTGPVSPETTLFAALEKLGLELKPETQPRSVIVVDHADQTPAPNPEHVIRPEPTYPQEFEAASVKPYKPEPPDPKDPMGRRRHSNFELPNGQVSRLDTLHNLIVEAYSVEHDYMVSGPKWLDSDLFEITAKTGPNVPNNAIKVMLQHLLADRFKLQVHPDVQPVDVYALTLGKSAPKLTESAGGTRSECKGSARNRKVEFVCRNTNMEQLANKLALAAPGYIRGRPVVDLTGLKVGYDFTVSWAGTSWPPAGGPAGGAADNRVRLRARRRPPAV